MNNREKKIDPKKSTFRVDGKPYSEKEYCKEHICQTDENLWYVPPWTSSSAQLEPCLRTTCGCKFDFPKK